MVESDFPPFAFDDELIDTASQDGQTRVRVYRMTSSAVVLGAGSRPDIELNLEACRADGIPIYRRRGGGCAVVLDPGNVIVSVVATGLPFGRHLHCFDTLTAWLIEGLDRIGIRGIRQEGICDFCLGDRKVGGACLHRSRDLLYYSTSLLVDPDIDAVSRFLKHPPREPDYRASRSHAEFMGTILAGLATETDRDPRTPLDACSIADRLRQALRPPFHLQEAVA